MPVIRRVKKSQVSSKNGPSTKSTTTSSAKTRAASATAKGRAIQKKTSEKTTPKRTARGSAKVTTISKPTSTKKTAERQIDPTTGFGVGTDSDVMIKEAMKGGSTRPEVIARIRAKLPKETASGSTKPVANVFASVLKKKLDQGYYIESNWVLRPPTPQSKAKATRARNASKTAEGDNVTPIKKTSKVTATRKRRAA
jgi:hypothetical protein